MDSSVIKNVITAFFCQLVDVYSDINIFFAELIWVLAKYKVSRQNWVQFCQNTKFLGRTELGSGKKQSF